MYVYKILPRYLTLLATASFVGGTATITITLEISTIPEDSYQYTITGVTSTEISNAPLVGTIVTTARKATLQYNISRPLVGIQHDSQFKLSIDNTSIFVEVNLLVTGLVVRITGPKQFDLLLTTSELTPVAYQVPYELSGVDSIDLAGAPMTDQFVIAGNQTIKHFSITAATESKTATVKIPGLLGLSTTVPLVDFSKVISIEPTTQVLDGTVLVLFTISTTSQIADGTQLAWELSGVASSEVNNATLTGVGAFLSRKITVEFVVSSSNINLGTLRLSLTDLPLIYSDIKVVDVSLTSQQVIVTEHSTLTFVLDTIGITNQTPIPYTITGVDSADINEPLIGEIVVSANRGQLIITTKSDFTFEGTETVYVTLTDNPLISASTDILDTSIPYVGANNIASVTPFAFNSVAVADVTIPSKFAVTNKVVAVPRHNASPLLVECDFDNNWIEIGDITGGKYGDIVASSGNILCVGTLGFNTRGVVNIYTRSELEWALTQTLNRPINSLSDWFGQSVVVSNSSLVVAIGSRTQRQPITNEVFIYTRQDRTSTFSLTQTITNPTNSELFGTSMSIDPTTDSLCMGVSGNTIVVYSRVSSTSWVLETNGGSNTTPTNTNTTAPVVSICGDLAVVYSSTEITSGTHGDLPGCVYVYTRAVGIQDVGYQLASSWTQSATIQLSNYPVRVDPSSHVTLAGKLLYISCNSTDIGMATNVGAILAIRQLTPTVWAFDALIAESGAVVSDSKYATGVGFSADVFAVSSNSAGGKLCINNIPKPKLTLPIIDCNVDKLGSGEYWELQYSPGANPATIGMFANPTKTAALVLDEIFWNPATTLEQNHYLEVLDYFRNYNIAPGITITPASELLKGVTRTQLLSYAKHASFVALDPYLLTAFIIGPINQTTVDDAINRLITWTDEWIQELNHLAIPAVLVVQGISEPGFELYVQQYLTQQYARYNRTTINQRIVFPTSILVGTSEEGVFTSIDNSPYIAAHPL